MIKMLDTGYAINHEVEPNNNFINYFYTIDFGKKKIIINDRFKYDFNDLDRFLERFVITQPQNMQMQVTVKFL